MWKSINPRPQRHGLPELWRAGLGADQHRRKLKAPALKDFAPAKGAKRKPPPAKR